MDKYQHQISQECEQEFVQEKSEYNSLNILIYIWPGQHDKTFRFLPGQTIEIFKSFHKRKIIFWLVCLGELNIILEEHSLVNNKM
jgi:hypothetical protein